MKVILSIEAVRFPLTGIGRYSYELAQGLMASSEIDSLKLFSGLRFSYTLSESRETSTRLYGLKRVVQSSRVLTALYQGANPAIRWLTLCGFKNHIYHSPNFFLPPFAGPKIATFHDLSAFTWAECYEPVKARFLQKGLRHTIDNANALITDSEFTRQELASFSGWPLEKIHAIPLASSPEFHPRGEPEVLPVIKKYGLNYRGYTLYVGTIEPRKNLGRLLDAYARMPLELRRRWPLVLSGYKGWQSEEIHRRVRDAERQGWARYLGFVPAAELPLLYAGARVFVFPSLYEGFGLPVLEAMSSGVPVICSNSSSLPEVAGSAALMSDAQDVVGMSENLERGLQDDLWREAAIAEGIERAGCFSWEHCVQGTIEVYRKFG
ncbi:glycosyltransferase family 1 protein [Marinobacter sp. Z-F4-2]|nr:glycosyltransferase family 1 protein [Marinobacter sp. Z-F4-2]